MATQRITIAKIGGEAAGLVARLFARRQSGPAFGSLLDRFCTELRANCSMPPVIYFCEWIDPWLLGAQIFGPMHDDSDFEPTVRFQACCMTPAEALDWAGRCGRQWPEQNWLAVRLSEAARAWESDVTEAVVVLIREVLAPTTEDQQVVASLGELPAWLANFRE